MSTEGTKALVFIRNAIVCCLVLCDKHGNNGKKTRIRLSHLFLFDSGSCFKDDFGWGAGNQSMGPGES